MCGRARNKDHDHEETVRSVAVAAFPDGVDDREHAVCRNFSRNDLSTPASVSPMAAPLASLKARTSSALARPCSLIFAFLIPLRGRQSNESRVSTPRSDLPWSAIVGATSSRIQWVTASAIGQRSVAAGEMVMRCLSATNTASSSTTSVAVHSPGPLMDGKGLKAAISANRDRHGKHRRFCANEIPRNTNRARARQWDHLRNRNYGCGEQERYSAENSHLDQPDR